MTPDMYLYFGTLALIAFGGLALIVWLIIRGDGKNGPRPKVNSAPTLGAARPPRVQVVQLEEGLVWVVNDKVVRDLTTLTDPQERAAVEAFMAQMQQMGPMADTSVITITEPSTPAPITETPLASPSSVVPPVATQPAVMATPASTPPTESPMLTPDDDDELNRPFFERVRRSLAAGSYDTKPRPHWANYTPPPLPGRGATTATTTQMGVPRLEELDTILQSILARIPNAPLTQIRPGPDGLLAIIVNGQVYDHINNVPNETVKEAMREAIAIWER